MWAWWWSLASVLALVLSAVYSHVHVQPSVYAAVVLLCGSRLNLLFLAATLYGGLYAAGRTLQLRCFGELSLVEFARVKEHTLNYVLFKVVFMGAILNSDVEDLLIWTTWFVLMGALRVFVFICRERFGTAAGSIRHVAVVCGVAAADVVLALGCWWLFGEAGDSTLLLLLFENWVVFVSCGQVVAKHCCSSSLSAAATVDFAGDALVQISTLAHFVHVWAVYGVSFTLIDLFLFMNMRSVVVGLAKRAGAFIEYRRVLSSIRSSLRDAENLGPGETCRVCLEPMDSGGAKRLPCSHCFHQACLEEWVRHRRLCPICRAPVRVDRKQNDDRNSVFYFSTRAWLSWLPPVSVEMVRSGGAS